MTLPKIPWSALGMILLYAVGFLNAGAYSGSKILLAIGCVMLIWVGWLACKNYGPCDRGD